MTKMCMIMAIGPKGVIGKGDKLAWHSKNDFHHFIQQTKGWPCIFGATTFYGLPKYPLKNRLNIVVDIDCKKTELVLGKNGNWIQTNDIKAAISLTKSYDKAFICGGKSIYKYCLDNNLIDEVYLTKIQTPDNSLEKAIEENPDDFVYFPIDLDEYLKGWKVTKIEYLDGMIAENYWCHFIKFTK